jgi:hypothetical protein
MRWHDAPAVRQMLAPLTQHAMIDPMHPPLARQLIALMIVRTGFEVADRMELAARAVGINQGSWRDQIALQIHVR